MDLEQLVTYQLTARELVLIRVALIQRLDRLRSNGEAQHSYHESKALVQGKLHFNTFHPAPTGEALI